MSPVAYRFHARGRRLPSDACSIGSESVKCQVVPYLVVCGVVGTICCGGQLVSSRFASRGCHDRGDRLGFPRSGFPCTGCYGRGSARAAARSVRFTIQPASRSPYGLDQGGRSICSVHEQRRPRKPEDPAAARLSCLVAYATRAAAGWTIEYKPPENRVSAKPEARAQARPSFVPFKRKPAHTRPRSRNLASIASPSTTSHW